MNLQDLQSAIDRFQERLGREDRSLVQARLEGLISVFPFNEYEYVLTFLVDRHAITFDEYENLRQRYVSANRYLDLFSLAPRVFGQVWGEQHLLDLDPRFMKPSRTLDPDFAGQYDLWLEGVRVEVKAARAIHTRKRGAIASKALHFGSSDSFWMNFQQLKLDACDVFVFIGVWVDTFRYWVMSNKEVKTNAFLSHQHRRGIEYQIGVTHKNIAEFDAFLVEANAVADTILSKHAGDPGHAHHPRP